MDDPALLRLQVAWGADEALQTLARDRITVAPTVMPALPLALPQPGLPAGVAQARALAAAASTLPALRAALATFNECPLQATAMSLVFAAEPAAADLMLIGDAPGEEEDRTGRPFSGPGGRLLDKMLASIGLDRATLLLGYAVPWRPPGNRKPTEQERAMCLPFLHRHLALARPARLLLFGTPVAATLLGVNPARLKTLRGRWQSVTIEGMKSPIEALPTHALEQALASPGSKEAIWADLLILKTALDNGPDP